MRVLLTALSVATLWNIGCDRKTSAPLETKTSEGQVSQAPAGKAAARNDRALVRFINGGPQGGAKELWAGQTRLFSDIGYKTVTPYIEIPSQATQFYLREPGQSKELAAVHDELFAGRNYTYVAMPDKKGRPLLVAVSDDLAQPKSGKAKVRVINATQDLDNLELFEQNTNKKLGHRVRTGAVTEFAEVDPGKLEIHLTAKATLPVLSNLMVEPDKFYTFVIVGTEGATVVRIEEQLSPSAVRGD